MTQGQGREVVLFITIHVTGNIQYVPVTLGQLRSTWQTPNQWSISTREIAHFVIHNIAVGVLGKCDKSTRGVMPLKEVALSE